MIKYKRQKYLRVNEDFFNEKIVKYLKRLDRGETLVIIYLKLQLKSLDNNGKIYFCNNLYTEMANIIEEDEKDVKRCIDELFKTKFIELRDNNTLVFKRLQE